MSTVRGGSETSEGKQCETPRRGNDRSGYSTSTRPLGSPPCGRRIRVPETQSQVGGDQLQPNPGRDHSRYRSHVLQRTFSVIRIGSVQATCFENRRDRSVSAG